MSKYILQPIKIAENIWLSDCLAWITSRIYSADSSFFLSELAEGNQFWPTIEYPFVLDNAPQHPQLPENPKNSWDILKSSELMAKGRFEEALKAIDEEREESRKRNIVLEAYHEDFYEAWSKFYDKVKSILCGKLQNGEIIAKGTIFGKIRDNNLKSSWRKYSSWLTCDMYLDGPAPEKEKDFLEFYKSKYGTDFSAKVCAESKKAGFVEIDQNFWRYDGIDWLNNEARSDELWYKSHNTIRQFRKKFPLRKRNIRQGLFKFRNFNFRLTKSNRK